jgi:hypothetical protein
MRIHCKINKILINNFAKFAKPASPESFEVLSLFRSLRNLPTFDKHQDKV